MLLVFRVGCFFSVCLYCARSLARVRSLYRSLYSCMRWSLYLSASLYAFGPRRVVACVIACVWLWLGMFHILCIIFKIICCAVVCACCCCVLFVSVRVAD